MGIVNGMNGRCTRELQIKKKLDKIYWYWQEEEGLGRKTNLQTWHPYSTQATYRKQKGNRLEQGYYTYRKNKRRIEMKKWIKKEKKRMRK